MTTFYVDLGDRKNAWRSQSIHDGLCVELQVHSVWAVMATVCITSRDSNCNLKCKIRTYHLCIN